MESRGARRVGRAAARSLAASSLLLLAACSADPLVPPPPTSPPVARPMPGSVPAPTPIIVAPLRGTLMPTPVARPSLAVKIDDHEEARPQLALNASDLAFEELVEGGLTRYAVVWHSELPDEVGPVRSIRPMDPDILTPLGGIVAYSGGQEQFVELMMETPLVNLVFDYDDTGLFFRADDRPSPHDVILRAAEAVSRNEGLAPPPMQFRYGNADPLADPRLAATGTSRIDLVFSEARAPSWEWDAGGRVWLRSQEGTPDLDASGDRVRARNVVTLRVAIDWSYGEVPRTVLAGSGEAWVSTDGRTAHGTWTKEAPGSSIRLAADDGGELPIAPGNTWIELVPNEGSAGFLP